VAGDSGQQVLESEEHEIGATSRLMTLRDADLAKLPTHQRCGWASSIMLLGNRWSPVIYRSVLDADVVYNVV
jgi:hypothetical protein